MGTISDDELIEELRQIVKEDYGQDLDFKDAYNLANGLINYFDLLAKLHHRNHEDKHELHG